MYVAWYHVYRYLLDLISSMSYYVLMQIMSRVLHMYSCDGTSRLMPIDHDINKAQLRVDYFSSSQLDIVYYLILLMFCSLYDWLIKRDYKDSWAGISFLSEMRGHFTGLNHKSHKTHTCSILNIYMKWKRQNILLVIVVYFEVDHYMIDRVEYRRNKKKWRELAGRLKFLRILQSPRCLEWYRQWNWHSFDHQELRRSDSLQDHCQRYNLIISYIISKLGQFERERERENHISS